jgi:hypothetical protein
LFAGNVAQAYNLIDYIQIYTSLWAAKASEKTALPDIVYNFAFSSMSCIFFGQLLTAQLKPGVSLIF